MKKKIGIGCITAVAVALLIVEWIMLPDSVVVQIGFDGQASNVFPKFLAMLVPFGLSVFGTFMLIKGQESEKLKGWALAIAGIAVAVLNLLFNR